MRTRSTLALLASALLLGGCLTSGSIPQAQQFPLAPKFEVAKAAPTLHTLGLRPIAAARPYSLPMLQTDADGALVAMPNATWAEEPGVAVTRAIRDAIAQTGRFADVGDAAEMARPEYTLTGELRKFHEDRAATPPVAVVEVRLELRESLGAKQLWAQTLTASVPLTGARPADFANAVSAAVAELSMRAADGIVGVALP